MSSVDIQARVTVLNEQLEMLDRKFNAYFSGQEKISPVRVLEKLKGDVMQLTRARDRTASSSQRFFVNSFVQRFTAYRTKWEKMLKDIEEGRAMRGAALVAGRRTARPGPSVGTKAASTGDIDREIDRTAGEYSRLYEEHTGKQCNRDALEKQLQQQVRQIREKIGGSFTLDVSYSDGRITITPRKR